MLELLCRLQAISSFAKDCHYHFNEYSQHLLADVNEDDIKNQIDLINEVCYLGLGEDAPAKKDILIGALDYMPQPSNEEKENFAKLKLMIKECLVHLEQTEAKTRGANALLDNIAMTLQQLHGLLFKTVVDAKDIEYLNSLPDLMEEENYNESDKEKGEWITVRGTHIFVKDGESKEKAVKDFIAKKEKSEKGPSDSNKKDVEVRKLERKLDSIEEMIRQEQESPRPDRQAIKELNKQYDSIVEKLGEYEENPKKDTESKSIKENLAKKGWTETKNPNEFLRKYDYNKSEDMSGVSWKEFEKDLEDGTLGHYYERLDTEVQDMLLEYVKLKKGMSDREFSKYIKKTGIKWSLQDEKKEYEKDSSHWKVK